MAHHLTKKKSRLQNAEKASVAQIIANNNETLSKLIDGERTKVGFSGKTASTLNDVSVNSSPSVMEELLLSEKTEAVGVNDDLFLKDNSLTLDDESEIPSFQAHQDLTSATPLIDAEKQRIAQTNATADGPFDKSLPSGGREIGHSAAYLANEKVKTEAANDEANALMIAKHNVTHGTNYLNPVEVDVSGNSSSTAYRSMHGDMDEVNGLKQAEMFANGGTESYYFQTQDENGNDISVLIENEAEEKSIGVDSENLFIQNSKDGLITQERNGIGFTSDEITRQAIKQAADLGAEERETMSAEEIENISESIADKSKRLVEEEASKYKGRGTIVEGDDERAAYLQREIDKEKGKTPIEGRFDKARERQKLEEEKAEKEQFINDNNKQALETQKSIESEQKIMGAQNQLISEGPSSGRGSRGKFRKLQAEKQLAKEMEVAKRVGDHMDRNQAPKVGKNMWPLQNDPYSFSTLSYPPEATNSKENGHFMLFYVNVQDKTKYQYDGVRNGQRVKVGDYIERPGYFENPDVTNVPPSLRGANRFISSVEASGLGANAGTTDYQRQIVKNGGPGNILYNNMAFLSKGRKPKSGINSRYPTTTRITDSVALYLPSGIGNTTSASYGDFQTGVAGYLAMSGLDIVSELRNRDFQGAAEKLFGVGGTLITEAAKKLAVAGIETFTGSEGIQQSIDKAFGQTLNPYIEVAFNSTGMRTFDYTFKFAPKSKEETDEVQAIIQLFRFHMLPEMKSAAHRYLTLPSTFDIHYMWQSGIDERGYSSPMARENSFYNKIATCVLTNVDVNYTPNGQVQSFADGAPTQIDMSLSFKETEMLTKQHIQEGF